MNEPDFPEGFQGAGPVFAAVPLGDPWYNVALTGATTYIPESARARVDAAFLDREQAECVADAVTDGELSRYEGLCGWNDVTTARADAERQAQTELEARLRTGDRLHKSCADWERGQASTPAGEKFGKAAINLEAIRPRREPEAGS